MACLIIPLVILALATIAFVSIRSARVRAASRAWWFAGAVLLILGLILGFAATRMEYRIPPDLRVVGFPIPLVIFQLEGGEWVDYPSNTAPLNGAADLLLFAVLTIQPLCITALIRFGWWPRRPTEMRGFPLADIQKKESGS